MLLDEEASSVDSLVGKFCGVGLMVLILSGCAVEGGADEPAATGAIEVAVSETCDAGSTPECVSVNGEHVAVAASDFLRAEVEAVAVADDQGANAVDVTLSKGGAAVLETSTSEVAMAGDDARLVIKVGGEVLSAVAVAETLRGDHF
jgi:hypothetical protein